MVPIDKEYPFASVAATMRYMGPHQSITSTDAFTEEVADDDASRHQPTSSSGASPGNVASLVDDCCIRICHGVQPCQRYIIWDDVVDVLKRTGLAQPLLTCKTLLIWFLRRLSMHNILMDRSINEFVRDRDMQHKRLVDGQQPSSIEQYQGAHVLLARCLDVTDVDVFCDIITWFVSQFYSSDSTEEMHINRILHGLWRLQHRYLLTDETSAAYRVWKAEYKSSPHGQHKLKTDLFALYDTVVAQQKGAAVRPVVCKCNSSNHVEHQHHDTSNPHTMALSNARATTPRPPMHHTAKLPPLHPRVMRTHTVYMLPPAVSTTKMSHVSTSNRAIAGCNRRDNTTTEMEIAADETGSATDVASWLIALRESL